MSQEINSNNLDSKDNQVQQQTQNKNKEMIYVRRKKKNDEDKKKKIKKCVIFGSIIFFVLICIGILLYFKIKPKKTIPETSDFIDPPFQPELKIKTEFSFKNTVGDYKRIFINQGYNETMVINGKELDLFLERKTFYDIFIISETKPEKEHEKLYSTMYTCSISIGKECISSSQRSCEPINETDPFFNADFEQLQLLEESDLKDAAFPLCTFNITDNDVITSMKCPESISDGKIKGIILDLYFFRPPAIERPDKKKNNVTIIKQNLENNKTFIRETNGGLCDIENPFNSFCTTEMNTTTDAEGNLLTYDEIAFIEVKNDELNSYKKNKLTNLIDITDEIGSFNKLEYKQKLDFLLSKFEPYMKYNEFFTMEQFEELYDVSKGINRRRLDSNNGNIKTYIQKKTLYEYDDISGVKLELLIKADSGLNSETMKSHFDFKCDSNQTDIIHKDQPSDLTTILKKFIRLSQAGNHLATQLSNNIKPYFENITKEISVKISSLNSLVVYKELSEIYDSSLSLANIQLIPKIIVEEINTIPRKLDEIVRKLKNGNIKNDLSVLNSNIYDFIKESHQLLRNIFENLKKFVFSLNSDKSRFSEIAAHYLGHSTNLYMNIIEKSENILKNYYINEKKKIIPEVELILKNFEDSFNTTLKKAKNNLNSLYTRLINKTLEIEGVEENEYENIISNVLKSINNLDIIMKKIEEYVREEMELKENDYFISLNDINSYKLSFIQVINDAKNIANKLDNDEFLDLKFDEIMTSFREVFIKITEKMDDLRNEQFKLEENVLNSKLFDKNAREEIKSKFEVIPTQIINFVTGQSDYISEIKELIEKFKENEDELNSIIFNLSFLFSNYTLEDLAHLYDVGFSSSLEKIDKEINENEFLALEYMTNMSSVIKNNSFILEKLRKYQLDEEHYPQYLYYWSNTHYVYRNGFEDSISEKKLTEGYQTKYNTFKANFAASENYIKDQLFLDLSSEYKNSLFKLRESLQSIKDNRKYFDKYPDYDFDFMDKHIDTVNNIYDRLNYFLSDEVYNYKYIKKIQDYKKNTTNIINRIKTKIENENEKITKEAKTLSDYKNDFCVSFYRKKTYTCTNGAISYPDYTDDYCCPLFIFSDNHNKLNEITIKNDKKIIEYNNKYNDFYKIIKDTIDNYNSKINILKKQIFDKEKEVFDFKIDFTNFQKEIDYIISKYYDDKLIKASYDYYNNNIRNKVGNIINQISNEWYIYFDELKESIKNNTNFFKNSIIELPLMASIYETIINQNTTRDFFNSIITHQRNQFNYTILYYYNYLFKFINTTHHYIINQVPIGQKGLTLILDTRKQEINDYFINLIKNISQLRDESLGINKQLEVLQVNETDFFNINSVLNDNIQETKYELNYKIDELINMDNEKENDKFSLSLRYYLENNNNGDLIKKLYKSINEGNFIDLKLDEFKNLIFNNWIFEPDKLKNNLNKSISNSNLEIKKEFSMIRKNFEETLKAQMPLNLSLENSINYISNLYKSEISSIDGNLNKNLVNNISVLLNVVKEILYNESEKFIYDPISYNNNYTKINNTIKEIKEEIYNKTYLIIYKIIDDFHQNMINKLYNNYYNYHLNLFVEEVNLYRELTNNYYRDYNLLNSSYNFGKTIDNIVEEFINNYNNTIKKTIDVQYNTKLKIIIDWKEIKDLINNEIDSVYEENLYSNLKKYATFDSKISDYIEYDLNEKIKKEIEVNINSTMNTITNIVNLIKGNNYNLDYYLEQFEFSQISSEILDNLKESFIKFYNSQEENEIIEINNLLSEIFKNNFYDLLNYLIPSFGNTFFERVFKYNQNFKIENLYNNLKYSLAHTLLYYISLKELTEVKELPTDLKNKLFHINNLDLIVENKNEEILNLLEVKIEEFIEESKKEIIKHYISRFDNETILITYFDQKIMKMIEDNLMDISNDLEQIYFNFISKYLKEKFAISYSKEINEKSKEMIKFVNFEKEKLRIKIYDLLTINPDKELNEINEKMNMTEKSIEKYISHFNNSFFISDDLNNFLISYASSNIEPLFIKLIDIIHSSTKSEVLDNLEKNSKIFEDNYNPNKFYNYSNNTLLYFKDNFIDNINKSLNDYGTDNYIENLDNEIFQYEERYRNRRALTEEDIIDKISDKQLDYTLRDLLTKFNSTKSFLNSLKEFNDFDNIIANNLTKLKTEYKEAENILKNNNYDDDLYWNLHNKILDLKNLAEDYYLNINESYYIIKHYLFNSIYELNSLLNECANITFKTIENKYDNIIKTINSFHNNYTLMEEEKMRSIQNYYAGQHNGQKIYNTEIENSNKTTEFLLEYEYNNKKPILKAKIVNLCSPKKMYTKIISGTTDCGTTETDLDVQFDGSNITMVIYYDTNSTDVNVKTYTHFEKYYYNKIVYHLVNDENSNSNAEAGGNSISLDKFKNKKNKCLNIERIIQYQNSSTIHEKEYINNENITLFN